MNPYGPFNPPLARTFIEQPEVTSSWLVRGFIKERGFSILSGPPKLAGKSLYADLVSLSLAANIPVGLDEITRQCNVLSVQEETPMQDAQDRLRALAATHGLESGLDHLWYSHLAGTDLLSDTHCAEMCRVVREQEIGLVVLDPWSNVFPDDENDKKLITKALGFIRHVQLAGAAVLLIMHWNKEGMKDRKMDMDLCLRGHTALQGAYDTHRALRRYSEEETETRVCTRNRHAARIEDRFLRWKLLWEFDPRRGDEVLTRAEIVWR